MMMGLSSLSRRKIVEFLYLKESKKLNIFMENKCKMFQGWIPGTKLSFVTYVSFIY